MSKSKNNFIMPHDLRLKLQEYLTQLEASISSEDVQFFDEGTSRLIDCVRVLLEEG